LLFVPMVVEFLRQFTTQRYGPSSQTGHFIYRF
jgi:hypothetical protein